MAKGARVRDELASAARQAWETPPALFETLHNEYRFTVDAAANADNAKLARFWTREHDGLAQRWEGERVFCNPPYNEIAPWVERAWAAHDKDPSSMSALLLPARTGAGWFADFALEGSIHWFRGRVQFRASSGVAQSSNAEDSILVVFGVDEVGPIVRDSKTGRRIERVRPGALDPLPFVPAAPVGPCKLCGEVASDTARVFSALTSSLIHEWCGEQLVEALRGLSEEDRAEAQALLRG